MYFKILYSYWSMLIIRLINMQTETSDSNEQNKNGKKQEEIR